MMQTTAAIATGEPGGFRIATVELDDLRDDEVLVDVVAVGMCHTDLSAASGVIPFPLPGVLGHEGAGRVRATGRAVTRVRPGDAVLMTFTSCGRCRQCRGGHPAHCDHHLTWNLLGGARADGTHTMADAGGRPLHAHFFGQSSFARHAIVDERSLVALPGDVGDDDLALYAPLGCGLQTGAGAVLNVLRPATDDILAVSGAGAVGLAAVMAARAVSVQRIVVVDRVPERLRLAQDLGATDVLDDAEALRELTGDAGVQAAVETTGNVGVLEAMIASLGVGGTCAVVGAPRAGSRASFDVNAHLPGRRIVGVTLGDSEPERFVPQLIALHRSGRFPIERLERRYPFAEIAAAAADAASGRTVKPVLVMEDV
ncbi:MAG: NAD(P)-dependent alcohol dehydrogenase [Microbacterium sp.]